MKKRRRQTQWRVARARGDLQIAREEGAERLPWTVVDEAGRQRIRLDAVGAVVLDELQRERGARELHGAVERRLGARVPPRLLARHVQHLARSYLLEGPRSLAWVERVGGSSEAAGGDRAAMPLDFLGGLQHECQACGACCLGTDVGPLPAALVERLDAHDWGDRVAARREGIPLFREARLDGDPLWLMGSRNDACVFLRDDKLCQIHAELGAAAKPSMCRQFPYLFTQVPGGRIAVSVQMECRAYLKAKRAASPPAEQQQMLRELLGAGAFVQTVLDPVQVAPGLAASWEEAAALERELLGAFGAAGAAVDGACAAAGVVAEWAARRTEGWEEPHLEPELWAGIWPEAFGDVGGDDGAVYARRSSALVERLSGHLCEEALRHREAGHHLEADRFALLERGLRAAHGQLDVTFFRAGPALDEILSDSWRAAVFAKEPLQGGTIVDGLARINLRLVLIRAIACLRARDALRMHVTDQDSVDSMVLVNKMGRQRSVALLLRSSVEALSFLYFDNAAVLLAGSDPRPASHVTGLTPS